MPKQKGNPQVEKGAETSKGVTRRTVGKSYVVGLNSIHSSGTIQRLPDGTLVYKGPVPEIPRENPIEYVGPHTEGKPVVDRARNIESTINPQPVDEKEHHHRWKIEEANGAVSRGACGCGEVKEFKNYLSDYDFITNEEYRNERV